MCFFLKILIWINLARLMEVSEFCQVSDIQRVGQDVLVDGTGNEVCNLIQSLWACSTHINKTKQYTEV